MAAGVASSAACAKHSAWVATVVRPLSSQVPLTAELVGRVSPTHGSGSSPVGK